MKNTSSGTWEKARLATKKIGDWYVLTAPPDIPLLERVRMARQIHGGNIVAGEILGNKDAEADGVWIKEAGISGGVYTADCMPLTIVGQTGAMVLHISRKTLVQGLLDNALTYLVPSDIDRVYIGPHICQLHLNYEEEGYLLRLFRYRYPEAVHYHAGKIYISLLKAVKQVLAEWEVHPDKIEADKRCTYENLDLPSYRRWLEGGKVGTLGRISTVVWRQGKLNDPAFAEATAGAANDQIQMTTQVPMTK